MSYAYAAKEEVVVPSPVPPSWPASGTWAYPTIDPVTHVVTDPPWTTDLVETPTYEYPVPTPSTPDPGGDPGGGGGEIPTVTPTNFVWPPAWPVDVPYIDPGTGDPVTPETPGAVLSASITLTAVEAMSTGNSFNCECRCLAGGADSSDFRAHMIQVSASIGSTRVKLKGRIGDAYSDIIFISAYNYTGSKYGFYQAIWPELSPSDAGKTLTVRAGIVTMTPHPSASDTVLIRGQLEYEFWSGLEMDDEQENHIIPTFSGSSTISVTDSMTYRASKHVAASDLYMGVSDSVAMRVTPEYVGSMWVKRWTHRWDFKTSGHPEEGYNYTAFYSPTGDGNIGYGEVNADGSTVHATRKISKLSYGLYPLWPDGYWAKVVVSSLAAGETLYLTWSNNGTEVEDAFTNGRDGGFSNDIGTFVATGEYWMNVGVLSSTSGFGVHGYLVGEYVMPEYWPGDSTLENYLCSYSVNLYRK